MGMTDIFSRLEDTAIAAVKPLGKENFIISDDGDNTVTISDEVSGVQVELTKASLSGNLNLIARGFDGKVFKESKDISPKIARNLTEALLDFD